MDQWERVRSLVTAEFLVYRAYCDASEQLDIALLQKRRPFGIEGSGEIYIDNLKWLGSSYPFGRHRSLTLLPEVVLRNFTREALVQDLLDFLPSPQCLKFLSKFQHHNAKSQVMQTDVRLNNQQSCGMMRPMK